MTNQLKSIALLGALSVLLVGVGGLISTSALWLFAAVAVVMNIAAYFYSDRVVLAMNRAEQVTAAEMPGLHGIVADVARRAELPRPRVYIVDDDTPNAFATGRDPAHAVVAVTTGLMRILDERELRGVIAHEMAHIKNRDILVASIAAMIATAITFVASVVRWGLIFGSDRQPERGGLLGVLLMVVLAPIGAAIIQLALSRTREFEADASGARIISDPRGLADALVKLERGNRRFRFHAVAESPATASLFICSPLAGARWRSWFSTHPPMEERIRRLRALAERGG